MPIGKEIINAYVQEKPPECQSEGFSIGLVVTVVTI